jgi:hypothetical protein
MKELATGLNSEITAYWPIVLKRPEYELSVAAPAANVTLPPPPWMTVQLKPTGSPVAHVIVVADPLVQ